ncbi:transporter [Deinococcus sp.]|uniref:ZIP family metal transporter n=1 Tax=Deinococcus sp. TaxID=47478 RepID=UPI0025B9934B|nr:transporter [Deinococcus sp.]
MPSHLSQILTLTAIPVASTILGGAVASVRQPSDSLRSFVQHFAGGLVIAVVAGELLPQLTRTHELAGIILGFVLGVVVMLMVQRFAENLEKRDEGNSENKSGLLAAVGIDCLLDGLLIGVGFSADARIGLLLVVAMTLEMGFLGVSLASSLGEAGWKTGKSILTVAGLALMVALGALIGGTLLGGLTGFPLAVMLSFGAAALLFLVTEELLIEAHEVAQTPWITSAFFAGFLTLYIIGMLSEGKAG